MQLAVTALINAARIRLAAKAPCSRSESVAALAKPQPHLTAYAPTPENTLTLKTYTHFVPSPLVGETSPNMADLMVALHRAQGVQRAAAEYKLTLARLLDVGAYRGAIARAINFARENDLGLSPEVIGEIIDGMSASLDEEVEAAIADKAQHAVAEKSAMARHLPLRTVVSKHLDRLIAEREGLLQADDAERRANRIGLNGYSRFAELRKAGLTDSQIAGVLPGAASPEAFVANRNERCAELGRQIESLRSFSNSATFDALPIVAVDPAIDAAIVARDGALPAEVA